MRKAVWSVGGALALVLSSSTSAYAQLDTEVINATAVVAARGRITLTGAINFPDTDPFTNPTINAAPLSVQALARVAVGAGVSLTVKDLGSTIEVSDQGGLAARWIVTPAVHLIGDGSLVSYRRYGAADREMDASGLAGASLLLSRGWIQVNAARFSRGELPVVSQPLTGRQSFFAAGELDAFARLRVFGGWEAFEFNLNPEESASASPTRSTPANDGTRGFGGVRMPVGAHSSVALRVEQRDRRSRVVGAARTGVSDTGLVTAEWQAGVGTFSSVARYSRRQNVEADNLAGSHTVDDTSAHLFLNVSRTTQIFGNAGAMKTTARDDAGNTFWQIGGGSQAQLLDRSLWLRRERRGVHQHRHVAIGSHSSARDEADRRFRWTIVVGHLKLQDVCRLQDRRARRHIGAGASRRRRKPRIHLFECG